MKHNYPFFISVSFDKVLKRYQKRLETEQNPITQTYIKSLLAFAQDHPELINGIAPEQLDHYKASTSVLLDDIFPNMLSENEIKAAAVPFEKKVFHKSTRLQSILKAAGKDYDFLPRDYNPDYNYLYACVLILNNYYGYKLDFFRPIYYDIPDKNGVIKTYRLFINADFVEIKPTSKAIELDDAKVDELISNPHHIELWKQYFPEGSWEFRGFTLLNFTDITIDEQISDLKSILINRNLKTDVYVPQQLTTVFRNIFKIPDLEFGFTLYNASKHKFEHINNDNISSFILGDIVAHDCSNSVCKQTLKTLFEDHEYFCISDVDAYAKATQNNQLSQNLLDHQFHSCILAPIAKGDVTIGVLEIVAHQKNQLNQINAIKLNDVLPYLYAAAERNKIEAEHRIKAVIQSKCTSIHSSVEWRFEEEAQQYIEAQDHHKHYNFKDIVFDDVYPLYGQIDIVSSSNERNMAIIADLKAQLQTLSAIFKSALDHQPISIFEQSIFRIEDFLKQIDSHFTADLEQQVANLIQDELSPVLQHIKDEIPEMRAMVSDYKKQVKPGKVLIYNKRDHYDFIVQRSNEQLAVDLDHYQKDAQAIFPHYFERYKTDGVEHNMYIGQSITKSKKFNPILLKNLRLWQLQVMCHLENKFYELQENSKHKLNAASLILAFNSTLAIRYRMDEKKFDVDGTYNARYEVIKKRIDKALIQGTQERATQKGKIVIVYTNEAIKTEYMKYISYLQKKKLLGKQVENVKLADVQGISGLKAIRVDVMYNYKEHTSQIKFEDLMKTLH